MKIPWRTPRPFGECSTCHLAMTCFYMRKALANYIYFKHCSPLGNRYPYKNNVLCEYCVMRRYDFKRDRNCKKCQGRGVVETPKIKSGWRPYAPDNLTVLGGVLGALPEHQRKAVQRWIIHGELGNPVEAEKWMSREKGYRRQRQNPSMVYLFTTKEIVHYYIRTYQRRRPTLRNQRYYDKCLEKGLRTLALEYEKFSFEEVD